MIKISESLKEIINKNQFLKFGLSKRLFNLTQLSKFLKPQLEARTKKSIKTSAITMNLSRIQRTFTKIAPKIKSLPAENITIHSHLATLTYFKSKEAMHALNTLASKLQKRNLFMTITEGATEITIILDQEAIKTAKETIKEKHKYEESNLTAIGIKFTETSINTPGLLNLVTQLLAYQYINIVEITSTYTEFLVYVNEKDTRIAFDTLISA